MCTENEARSAHSTNTGSNRGNEANEVHYELGSRGEPERLSDSLGVRERKDVPEHLEKRDGLYSLIGRLGDGEHIVCTLLVWRAVVCGLVGVDRLLGLEREEPALAGGL